LDKYFLLYSHYIFWNVMVLLLEYVFSVLFPPLVNCNYSWLHHIQCWKHSGKQ